MRLTILLSMTIAMALPLGVFGCGGGDTEETTPAGAECHDYSGFNADTPTVSLKTDVMPIFQNSCTFSGTCHGAKTGSAGKVYLGPGLGTPVTDMDLADVVSMNVGQDSSTGVKTIVSKDPQHSFLMHKMDGTLTCGDIKCTESCGAPMPQSGDMLSADKRDTVRRWIAQGAQNN